MKTIIKTSKTVPEAKNSKNEGKTNTAAKSLYQNNSNQKTNNTNSKTTKTVGKSRIAGKS